MQYRAMAAVILLAHTNPIAAQDVQKIEVTGAYHAQRRDDTAGATIVGREELLRHGDRSLADALRRVPGLTVADHDGKGSEIRMRGLGKGYTSVLLNGAPLPAGFSIDALTPAMIERIEVIRTASAELSAQGIAGTINIILRRQGPRVRNDARFGADRVHGVLAPSASWQWAGADDALDWSLGGAFARTAQWESGASTETGTDRAGASGLLRHETTAADNRTHSASLSPRVTWKRAGGALAWQGFVNLMGRSNRYVADETTLLGPATEYPHSGSRLEIQGVMLRSETTWQQELAAGLKGQARLALQHYPRRSEFDFYATRDGARAVEVRHVRSDIRESTLTASAKLAWYAFDGHSVTAGWDAETVLRSQTRGERDWVAGTAADDRYRGHIGRGALFVQDDWTLSDAWSLSAGLRWEALRTAVAPNGGAPVAQRASMASPLLQALYKWSGTQRVRAGLSRTYKTPAMLELIPRRYTIDNGNSQTNPDNQGNPRLRPELAWGLDVSAEQDLGSDGALMASAYRRHIANVNLPLLFEDHGRWVRTPANQGSADTWGMALEWRASPLPALTVRAHIARDWSRVAAVPGPDNRLARQAPGSAGLGADYRYGPTLTLGADLAWQDGGWARESPWYAVHAAPVRKLDVYAAWRLGSETRLRISAANLLPCAAQSGSTYQDDGGARTLAEQTRGSAVLRVSLEHRW